MSRHSRFLGGVLGAVLLVSAAAVVSLPSAGATDQPSNESQNQPCATAPLSASTGVAIANSGTFTLTLTSDDCKNFNVTKGDLGDGDATVTVNGYPFDQNTCCYLTNGTVIVLTAPSSGQGSANLSFLRDDLDFGGGYHVAWGYQASSGLLTDNNDGTLSFTFSGLPHGDLTHPDGQMIYLVLMDGGSTCLADFDQASQAGGLLFPIGQGSQSPAVLQVGTGLYSLPNMSLVPIVAQSYEACVYQSDQIAFTAPQIMSLIQSMSVTFGAGGVRTTTTTTAVGSGDGDVVGDGGTARSDDGADSVTPAFTG